MIRTAAFVALGVLAFLQSATAQDGRVSSPSPVEFDVASIKVNTAGAQGGGMRSMPDGTQVMVNVTIRQFIGAAYPSESGDYIGLPDWAGIGGTRYDVTVKPPQGAPREAMRDMWRHFFRERLHLEAHEESTEKPIYLLMLARDDGRLGPQLKVSPRDCKAEAAAARAGGAPRQPASTPPTEAEILERCGGLFGPGRIVSGGMPLSALAPSLAGIAGRPIEDRTGLAGDYAFTLTYSRPQPGAIGAASDPADGPDIFTALREQLGLKLEPARKPLTSVVIDHIERPTEN